MPLVSWISGNLKLASLIASGTGLLLISTGLFVSKNSGRYLFRCVPDTEKDYVSTASQRWSETMDGKDWNEYPLVNHSYSDLIDGSTEYNKGNYLIYYGSEACPHCTGFLFGDQNLARGTLNKLRDKASNGKWMQTFESVKTDDTLNVFNIKFLMFEDIPEKNEKYKDELWTLPWSSLENKPNEYKRNDQSAKDFREIFKASRNKFGAEKVPGTPTVIVYKRGIPKVFGQDQLPGLELQSQGEALDKGNDLYKFIKHYYTQSKE